MVEHGDQPLRNLAAYTAEMERCRASRVYTPALRKQPERSLYNTRPLTVQVHPGVLVPSD